MKKYEVKFKDIFEKKYLVEAESKFDAVNKGMEKYLNESEVLDENDFCEAKIFVDELIPDVDDYIFDSKYKTFDYYFRNALMDLCLAHSWHDFCKEEIIELIHELPWDEFGCDGHMDFEHVYETEVDSTDDIIKLKFGDLFGQKGIKIHSNIIEKVPGCQNLSVQYELWLLEDFSFAAVQRRHIKSSDNENCDYIFADIRFIFDEDYFDLIDDIYFVDFLDDIEEFMNYNMD